METQDRQDSALEQALTTRLARRQLLKAAGVASGAIAAKALLPAQWVAPVVGAETLNQAPTTSPVLGTGDLQVTLTWNLDETDVDLFVIEPDGTLVGYYNEQGPTAELDVDDTDGFGPENIYVAPGEAAAGVYKVYVGYYWDDTVEDEGPARPVVATIKITTFDNTPQKQTATYVRNLPDHDEDDTLYCVAEVTFPAGTIVEKTCTIPHPTSMPASSRRK